MLSNLLSIEKILQAGRLKGQSLRPGTVKDFHFSILSRPALGSTQRPIQWIQEALSPEVKQRAHEADHSSPTTSKVKKTRIYTSTPPYVFMA
jgi:hypothetical protein